MLTSLAWHRRVLRLVVWGWLITLVGVATPKMASAGPEPAAERQNTKRKKKRKKRKKRNKQRAAPRQSPGAAPDAGSIEPTDGVWSWVRRMGGEVPTMAELEALRESRERAVRERDWASVGAPELYYRDPEGALATHPLYLDRVKSSAFDIPVETNPSVAKWVKYFAEGRGRTSFARWLSRAPRYQPMMKEALQEAGLPRDLVYLSMIESGYNTRAYSHAAAAGLWQFIKPTGVSYGLRVDDWVDERQDPEASLHAAIQYLGELHRQFGDWRLAWAAYNTGPGRVRSAIKKARSRDFWVLARKGHLFDETVNYVPKIMAAAIVGRYAPRYGFTDIRPQEVLRYDTVPVEGSVDLQLLAECAGTSLEGLQTLNPALRRLATPPEGYDLRVPRGRAASFSAKLAAIPKSDLMPRGSVHVVKRGESLSKIAARYGVTVQQLKGWNRIRNASHIEVGQRLVVGDPEPEIVIHTVRTGETLSQIAEKYGVATADLQRDNRIRNSSFIMAGQRLEVRLPAARWSEHKVKRGDNLSKIAATYGVTVGDLKRWNGLSSSTIHPGQRLRIRRTGEAG